jgi:serine phosphatase RsbU (regulator of sigma subunit)
MKFFLKICFISLAFNLSAQKDSLYKALITCSQEDSAVICNDLAFIYRLSDSDSAMYFAQKGLFISRLVNNKFEEASSENEIGIQYHIKMKYDLALSQYLKAIKLYEASSDKNENSAIKAIASTYQNIGKIYHDQSRYQMALKYFFYAIENNKKVNNLKGLANLYNNVAIIYSTLNENLKSIPFHLQSLEIKKKYDDSIGIASTYGGLAVVYFNLKQYDKAIEYNIKKIGIDERYENQHNLEYTYNNIGGCYFAINDYDKAKAYYQKGIELAKAHQNYYGLADLYFNQADLHEKTRDYKSAFEFNKLYTQSKDSLFRMESTEKLLELETQYETEKKELQIKNQSFEIESQEKQNQQKSLIILFGSLALVGTGFFAAMAFINFKKAKKANVIIENQKMEVELKNEEVTHQKELVEEKQKEIIDSINYAKRIQQAVLTGEDVWKKVSKEHFILFKPKDIVSGDFYWAYNTPNNRSVFALADCTGHGVPGGFMSMLGNSFLNEIVVENKIFKADEILNKLRSKIIQALEQKGGTQQKDGMDISLCVWNKLDNTLEFAGANNPLWLLKNAVSSSGVENRELQEYKADKMPIGTYLENEVPFSSTTIQLQKGDIIFLSTDGYADQFGGPKGKKYKYKPLIDSLIKNSNLSMEEQKAALELAFNDWKHHHEQVDDVSLIGVRV